MSKQRGIKRVVGLMAEASAYGALCIGSAAVLTFFAPLFETPLQRFMCGFLAMLLLVMVVLSTSSGSYVGIAIFATVYGVNLVVRVLGLGDRVRGSAKRELAISIAVLVLLVLLFISVPAIFDPAIQMVDKLVFQKGETASYIERSMWTRVGWQAFLDTNGFGVGIGSIRVSNWAVSIPGKHRYIGWGAYVWFHCCATPCSCKRLLKRMRLVFLRIKNGADTKPCYVNAFCYDA